MDTPVTHAPLSLSFAAYPSDFLGWSERVSEARESLQMVASAPNDVRHYRSLRVAEISQFAGISRRQWSDWCASKRDVDGDPLGFRGLSVKQMHAMMDELGIRPRRPADKRALRLLVTNFKGGAQKTTVCLNLVHYFGLRGYRVLAIDTDPQGTLSQHLGFSPGRVEDGHTIAPVYNREVRDLFGDGLRPLPSHLDGVDVLPANLSLTTTDFHIASEFVADSTQGRLYPLKMEAALSAIEDNYDVILIDSPPAFSFTAIAMGWVADGIIVPLPTQVPDFAGTGDFCEMLGEYTNTLERWLSSKKSWAPVTFLHARVTAGMGSDWVSAKSREAFGHHRLDEVIAESRPVANCLTVFKSVFEATSADTDAKGLARARDAYMALGRRIESLMDEGWQLQRGANHGT